MCNRFSTSVGAVLVFAAACQALAAEVGDRLQTTDRAVVCASPSAVAKARTHLDDSELLAALHCVHAEMGLHVIVIDPHAGADDSALQVSVTALDDKKITAYTDASSLSGGDIYELLRQYRQGR